MNNYIKNIELFGISAKGKTDLLNHLNGERITRNQAIKAKCYDCLGFYSDGKMDCLQPECPLYPYMPYRGFDPMTES
jgi:hypothetical protein